ncbi:HAD hydrolase family protein [Kurthia huakuii]|uniref:HAD hydrolase family protein n=1 Tax=Kurthia huakuii TaxID=1421019 RepID=UPI000497756E|nr:HAD hydrolase family protein [Kurthia huakuii]MBM7698924.1 hydroxymethylpyrimidine pyrophosphatase-like HAD family hydrolase [Kurthia huakuii]
MQFVFNLDQTISYDNQPVSLNLQYMFDFLKDNGHQLIFTSTGAVRNMLLKLDRRFHNEAMIGLEGAVICKEGALEQLSTFNQADFTTIQQLIEKYDATFLMESEWDYCYTGGPYNTLAAEIDSAKLAQNVSLKKIDPISHITILAADGLENLQAELSESGFNVQLQQQERRLAITPKRINKWHALQRLGVYEKDYVAIGSDLTDLAVLEHAEYASMINTDYTKSRLPNDDKVEKHIIDTCYELSKKYAI